MAISKGTFVAYSGGDSSQTSVVSTAFDSTAGGGANILLAAAIWEDANSSGLNFTDSAGGNSWQPPIVQDTWAGGGPHIALGWCLLTNRSATHTVTCNFGVSAPFRRIAILPVFGTFTAASLDTSQTTTGTTVGSPDNADAGTLVTTATALAIQVVADYNGRIGSAGPDGWSMDSATTGRHWQSQIRTGAATIDPVLVIDSGGTEWATIAAAFIEVGGGGGGVPLLGQIIL